MAENLKRDLTALINRYSLENESNTPDFILAQYLAACLDAYNMALIQRARWYGRMDVPGRGSIPFDEANKPMMEMTDPGPPAILEGPIDVNWF